MCDALHVLVYQFRFSGLYLEQNKTNRAIPKSLAIGDRFFSVPWMTRLVSQDLF